MIESRKKELRIACNAHTNLVVFASVVSILEGGNVLGGVDSNAAAQKIIDICKDEQQRLLAVHDAAKDRLSELEESTNA